MVSFIIFESVEVVENKFIKLHQQTDADKYILISNNYIDDFVNEFNIIDASKLLAINNPLSYKEFLPISRLQNKQKRVLIVSRLWNYKRIDMSLEIWKLIEEQVGDWELRIIGDGPEEEYLRRLVYQ